jgi:hypothetical protein
MLKHILLFVHCTTLFLSSDATTVAVVELGKGGVTRRITSASPVTSVAGVSSFWNAVHDEIAVAQPSKKKTRRARVTQYPGMTVVPDLWRRADGGLAIGITGSGASLADMPTLAGIMNGDGAVGHFSITGAHTKELMKKAGGATDALEASTMEDIVKSKASLVTSKTSGNKLETVFVTVQDAETAVKVDQAIASLIESLDRLASEEGSTVLLHLVMDDDRGMAHRRLKDDNQNQQNQNQQNQNKMSSSQSSYINQYGYDAWAYMNNNEMVTNVKTIFQIQYFNIVLWTAIGLCVVLLVVILMMINMPFMPDTLLFGESAKMVAE